MPTTWMYVAAALLALGLLGASYGVGRVNGDAICATQAAADQKKALFDQATQWNNAYKRLDDRYKDAIAQGNVLTALVRQKNDQIDRLQADARQEISHVVTDRQECRVPVSVIDRINGLSGFGTGGPAGPAPKPNSSRVHPTR